LNFVHWKLRWIVSDEITEVRARALRVSDVRNEPSCARNLADRVPENSPSFAHREKSTGDPITRDTPRSSPRSSRRLCASSDGATALATAFRRIARLRHEGSGKKGKKKERGDRLPPPCHARFYIARSKPSPHPFILPPGRFAGYFGKTIARQGGIEISANRISPPPDSIEFAASVTTP